MIKDTNLQLELEKKLTELVRLIDSVGPTPLRQKMNAHVVNALKALRNYKQKD